MSEAFRLEHGQDEAALVWRTEVLFLAAQRFLAQAQDAKSSFAAKRRAPDAGRTRFDVNRHVIDASGLFDPDFYLARHPDVRDAGFDPLDHYLHHGGPEGRAPSDLFDAALYLATYDDVRKAELNPLLHFIQFGVAEGRMAGAPPVLPEPRGAAPDLRKAPPGVETLLLMPTGAFTAVNERRRQHRALAAAQSEQAAAHHALQGETQTLRAEREAARQRVEDQELKLYVANASLHRAEALNDELRRDSSAKAEILHEVEALRSRVAALDHLSVEVTALRAARDENETLRAEYEAARRNVEDRELKLYVANASLHRAEAMNDELRRDSAAQASNEKALAERSRDLDEARQQLSEARSLLEDERQSSKRARSEVALAVQEQALTARDLKVTSRELSIAQEQMAAAMPDLERLRREESGLLQARAERDDLRVKVASLERGIEQAREEGPRLEALAGEIASGLAGSAKSEAVTVQLNEVRDRLAGRLELLTAEMADMRRGLRSGADEQPSAARSLYLDLLEATLTGMLAEDGNMSPWGEPGFNPERRRIGRDWPKSAMTMIGTARMRNVRRLLETVLHDGVQGDVLEAGVWRGGASIYMRGILAAYGVTDRRVWVADSFAGLPPPDETTYPADKGDIHHTFTDLIVPLDDVRRNFDRFGLLDRQVAFLPGWFRDTLPRAPVERLALLRLDGDMYSSTIETLQALYHKVEAGGFIIVDDYILSGCRAAVDDFRAQNDITAEMLDVDGAAAYWKK